MAEEVYFLLESKKWGQAPGGTALQAGASPPFLCRARWPGSLRLGSGQVGQEGDDSARHILVMKKEPLPPLWGSKQERSGVRQASGTQAPPTAGEPHDAR